MNSMHKLLLAGGLMAVATAAAADGSPVSANVALTSNYVWRGVSQTAEDPAIQGGFDYAHASGWYLGAWGSNVNFGDVGPSTGFDRAQLELDLYGGYKFKAAGLDWDVGFIHYAYPGAASAFKYDFTEIYGGLAWKWLTAKLYYTDDAQGSATTKEAYYVDVGASFGLPGDFTLGLHVGKWGGDGAQQAFGKKYTDYKLSVSKEYAGFGFGIAYTDTNLPAPAAGPNYADGQLILTVSKSM